MRKAIIAALRGAVRGGAQRAERMPRRIGGGATQMAKPAMLADAQDPQDFIRRVRASSPGRPVSVVDQAFDAPKRPPVGSRRAIRQMNDRLDAKYRRWDEAYSKMEREGLSDAEIRRRLKAMGIDY